MKTNPTYSVIIPHYNSWDSLEKLIQTIPADDEFEVIVVDDYSRKAHSQDEKERLDRINRELGLRNGVLLHNDGKKGAGTCRNVGLKYATGKWSLFADADDYFLPDMKSALEKFIDSNADIIFFAPTSEFAGTNIKANRHEEMETLIRAFLHDRKNRNKAEILLRYQFVVPWSKMIRRNFLQENEIGFAETIVSNDVMFSTKSGYFAKTVEATEECIYCATSSRGTLTTSHNRNHFNKRVDVFIERYRFLKRHMDAAEFKILNITGKGFVSEAFFSEKSIALAIETWLKYRKAGIRTFSILDLPQDVKLIVARIKLQNKEKTILGNRENI